MQLHAAEGTQEVIRFLNHEVADPSSPIGRHFTEDASFTLDNDVVATVMIKTSDFTQDDLQYLADYYTAYYPGQESLFADRILSKAQ